AQGQGAGSRTDAREGRPVWSLQPLFRRELGQPPDVDRRDGGRQCAVVNAGPAHADAEAIVDEHRRLAVSRDAVVLLVDQAATDLARALVAAVVFLLDDRVEARGETCESG